MTGVLEDHHIYVLEIDAGEKFDGISAVAYDQDRQPLAAAVVTRKSLPFPSEQPTWLHQSVLWALSEGVLSRGSRRGRLCRVLRLFDPGAVRSG